jgi:acetyltransferase
MSRTRVSRLLAGYRDRPAADREAIALALVRLSQLLVDLPEVVELDVNPLLADEKGVLALDARMRVTREPAADRLAIRPYPREQEETLELAGRHLLLRPIRPEDEPAHHAFLARLEPADVYFRFFNLVRQLPHSQMARYTQIDYDREMAFIATESREDRPPETLGVVRAVANPDATQAEFAIIVRSDLKGVGLGRALLEKMIRYCRERGIGTLVGQVLAENQPMLTLAKDLGFTSRWSAEEGVTEVRLELRPATQPARRPRRR